MLRVSSIGDACFSRSPGATGRGGWWSHLETADIELNVAAISIERASSLWHSRKECYC